MASAARGQGGSGYELSWNSLDGGGEMFSIGGGYELGGSIGQPDAGPPMTGGGFELAGGFWAGASTVGAGVPAAMVTAAVSRKANAAGPAGLCDLPLLPAVQSEPRQGGITELRVAFDVAPGGPGPDPITLEEATCTAPDYAEYSGASEAFAAVVGNELVLSFSPGLENARTYRIGFNSDVTTVAGQFVEVSGLLGDVNSDGQVNATDRSVAVGVWTGAGFSCTTDMNGDALTNATDRSIIVGAWTGGANCAP